MQAPGVGLLAGLAVGVTVAAEVIAVTLEWGRQPAELGVLFGLYEVAIAIIGALIAIRRPGNPIGWLLLGFAVAGSVLSDLAESYGRRASAQGWPGGPLAEATGLATWVLGALMWVLALLVTPTGHPPGRRWRLVAWAGILGVAIYLPGFALDPGIGRDFVSGRNPYAVAGLPRTLLVAVGGGLLCAAMIGAFASLVVRYRAAGSVERLQLKWVALAGLVLVTLLPVDIAFWNTSPAVQALTPVVLIGAVLCLGAAVLRYRLFDVGVIVNRTVVYLTLTVLLAAAYGATAIALGAMLGGFVLDGGRSNPGGRGGVPAAAAGGSGPGRSEVRPRQAFGRCPDRHLPRRTQGWNATSGAGRGATARRAPRSGP